MAQAVAHFLFPAFLASLFRDKYLKKKERKSFPLHYVLIAGLGGVLPDIDYLVYLILSFFGFTLNQVHRAFTHSLIFALCFLILGFIFHAVKSKELTKHKLKLGTIFFMLAFGILIHIAIDALSAGNNIKLLYPFSSFAIGLNLVGYLPEALQYSAPALLDGILLIIWIAYLEWKHKLSDFI